MYMYIFVTGYEKDFEMRIFIRRSGLGLLESSEPDKGKKDEIYLLIE